MIINPKTMPDPSILYPPINKRTYQEILFRKSLDPNMDGWERLDAEEAFLYRKDSDVEQALINRPDEEQRREAFMMSLYDAIETDDEYFEKRALDVACALRSNNAQKLLVALCGWNSASIAKRAGIIPDDGYDFYKVDPGATILVHWSNGETSKAKCKVDVATNKLYGYTRRVFTAFQNEATVTGVEVEVKPCFTKSKYIFNCITKEERNEKKDLVSYWYSPDPREDRKGEPPIIIDNPYM
jgi:hypothetical protein